MSTLPGPARARGASAPQRERPLSVVPRDAGRRPRSPFVVLVVALMAVGLVGLLLINTSMQRRAFELTSLQEEASSLQKREQALRMDVEALSSPDRIASRASRLGMVPNASPAFIRLGDGKILGRPRPAQAGTNLPALTPTPSDSGGDTADDRSDTGGQNGNVDRGSGNDASGGNSTGGNENGNNSNGGRDNRGSENGADGNGSSSNRGNDNAGGSNRSNSQRDDRGGRNR